MSGNTRKISDPTNRAKLRPTGGPQFVVRPSSRSHPISNLFSHLSSHFFACTSSKPLQSVVLPSRTTLQNASIASHRRNYLGRIFKLCSLHRSRAWLIFAFLFVTFIKFLGTSLIPPPDARHVINNQTSTSAALQSCNAHNVPNRLDKPILIKDNAYVSVLLVNGHHGVASDVEGVFHSLGNITRARFNVTHVVPGNHDHYYVNASQSKIIWSTLSHHCGQYDIILIGDTIPQGRSFIEFCQTTPIIPMITNRYDFAMYADQQYKESMAEASRLPNVRFLMNNLFEQYHIRTFAKSNLVIAAYIPSAGFPSAMSKSAIFDTAVETFHDYAELAIDDSEILVIPHRTSFEDVFVLKPLEGLETNFDIRLPRYYGGPLGIRCRILLHIPYQANTMSLFENLAVGVIYVLPSLELYRAWGDVGQSYLRVTIADHLSSSIPEYVYRQSIDWYRSDLEHLFYYFDDIEDLLPGSSFRNFIEKDARNKRAVIRDFMRSHQQCVIDKWEALIAPLLTPAKTRSSPSAWRQRAVKVYSKLVSLLA